MKEARGVVSVRETPIVVDYFSDVLCVWAYLAQARLEELERNFAGEVRVALRCCSVFGDTATKIGEGWSERGGYEGFGHHVCEVGAAFEHARIHGEVWRRTRPVTSEAAHLWIKAAQRVDAERVESPGAPSEPRVLAPAFAWRVRRAFFEECRDVARGSVLQELAEEVGLASADLKRSIDSGAAFSALAADRFDQERLRVEGSPTFVLDGGRQKLYGNVGYRVIEANLRELLRTPEAGLASWC